MSVLSIFGLTKKKNPPLSFYFVLFKNIQHQFWTCETLIYTISCTIKFSLKPRPISLQRTKTPSNYLSDLAIHKIILAISTISIPIILAMTNTPNFTSIILAISISIPKILAFPIEQKNIEEEGRRSREAVHRTLARRDGDVRA